MGWDGKGIMSGDEPMDDQSKLFDYFGVEQYPEDGEPNEITKEIMEAKLPVVWERLKRENDSSLIEIQVLGVLVLNSGAKFPPEIRDKVIECLERDEWAKEDLERRIYVQDMIDIIREYDQKENPGKTNYEKDYGITMDEWMYPRMSSKVVKLAAEKYEKYLDEYGDKWPLVKGISYAFQKHAGYMLAMLIDDSNEVLLKEFIQDQDFEWSGIFEIPLILLFTSDLCFAEDRKLVSQKSS